MTLRTNSFEGSTNGTTLTQGSGGNTGGSSGDYFDVVSIGTGAALTFDNTHKAHGGLAMKAATTGTAAQSFAEWTTQIGGPVTQLWFRVYIYFTSNPGATRPIARFLTSTPTQCARLGINSSGQVIFNDGANTTQLTSTVSIALNQWVRIEGYVIGNASTGQLEFKLYNTKDSSTPDDTKTSAASLNTTGSISNAGFGIIGANLASVSHWMDDIAVSDTAYVGPVPGVTGSGGISMFKMSLTGHGDQPNRGTGSISFPKMGLSGVGHLFIQLENNFEGGVAGHAITTSDTGSGNAWDDLGGSTTLPVYSSAAAIDGSLGASTPLAANTTTTLEWRDSFAGGFNASGSPWYAREYFKITSYPPAMAFLFKAQDDTVPVDIWAVSVNVTGHLGIRNRVLGTNPATATTAISLGSVNRWEAKCTFNGTTYSIVLSCYYGANADGSTPDEILSASISSSDVVNVAAFGAQIITAQTWSNVYHDNVMLTTQVPGPVNPTGTGSIALPKMGLTGSGTTHVVLVDGAINMPKMTLSGTSTEKISGDGTVGIPKMTLNGAGVGTVTLFNNFEGGQEGFPIQKLTDTGSGTPWDDMGGSFTLPLYTAAANLDGMSATTPLLNNTTTTLQWRESFLLGFNDNSDPWWGREYFKITSLPPATTFIVQMQDDVTPQDMFGIAINTTGHILLRNRITSTTLGTSSSTISLNTKNRVEFKIVYDGATYSITVWLFYGANADGNTPDETLTGSVSSALFVNVVGFGAQVATKNTWSTLYIDDIVLTSVAAVGPVTPTGTGSITMFKMSSTGTGTVGTPPGIVGQGSSSMGKMTLAAAGTIQGYISGTLIGANGGADGIAGQSAAQFQAEVTKFGHPLRLIKLFFTTKLGDLSGGVWQGSVAEAVTQANPGLVTILCWNTLMTQDEMNTFCNSIPPTQIAGFCWAQEVENTNSSGLSVADYQAGWADQITKLRNVGNLRLLAINCAAGYEYGPTGTGMVPVAGQYLPPEDLTDVYMVDVYQHEKGGQQSGITTWPAKGLATPGWSFDVWRNLVPVGSKWGIAEYGIDNCQEATTPGKRLARLKLDITWVESQNMWGFLYWDHTMSLTDCSKGHKLTTATEITIYGAFVATSGSISIASITGQVDISMKKMSTTGFATVGDNTTPQTRRVAQPSAFWYTYDSQFRRGEVIEGYKSIIWTERYSAYGDFQIITASTPRNRAQLALNTWIGKTGSNRVMKVLTISDDTAEDGTRLITVTGKSIETVFEDRVGMPGLSDTTTTPNWVLTGTPMDVANQMFQAVCVTTVLDPHDSIDYYQPGLVTPAGDLPVSSDIVTVTAQPDTLYNTLKNFCDTYNLGFRLIRKGNGVEPAEIHFEVYVGNDLTSSQTQYPAVIFDPDMENLSQISQLTSNESVKNVAYVYAQNGFAVVYPPGSNQGATGLQRRVLLVNSNNDGDAGPDLDTALQQEGLIALAQQRKIYSFDGQLPPSTKYVYGVDYNLGDLVEERASDGFGNQMLVTEQIFVSDDQGDRAYPTLSVYQTIVPDSWLAEGSIEWSTINPTLEWSDL